MDEHALGMVANHSARPEILGDWQRRQVIVRVGTYLLLFQAEQAIVVADEMRRMAEAMTKKTREGSDGPA